MTKAVELHELVRSKSARIDLDRTIFVLKSGERIPLLLPSWIEVKDHNLSLHIRVAHGESLPTEISHYQRERKGPISITLDDCCLVEARSPQGDLVQLEGVYPIATSLNSKCKNNYCVQTYCISFYQVNLLPEGMELLTYKEFLRELADIEQKSEREKSELLDRAEKLDEFIAHIPEVDLKIKNASIARNNNHPFYKHPSHSSEGCFVGDFKGGRFCLEQLKNGDLSIIYEISYTNFEQSKQNRKYFDALLDAVGFTHGCHPWPYYLKHQSNNQIVTRWVRGPRYCQKDLLLPMSYHRSPSEIKLFLSAAIFFARESDYSDYYRRILWLMRESSSKLVAMEVRLLTLCSVLEGLYKRNYDGGKEKRVKWKLSFEKYGIKWDQDFDLVFDSWESYRNKLAHGFDPPKQDGQIPDSMIIANSRITATIYILMAKTMGYAGKLNRSPLENRNTIEI